MLKTQENWCVCVALSMIFSGIPTPSAYPPSVHKFRIRQEPPVTTGAMPLGIFRVKLPIGLQAAKEAAHITKWMDTCPGSRQTPPCGPEEGGPSRPGPCTGAIWEAAYATGAPGHQLKSLHFLASQERGVVSKLLHSGTQSCQG
jgi:hypothetical protein